MYSIWRSITDSNDRSGGFFRKTQVLVLGTCLACWRKRESSVSSITNRRRSMLLPGSEHFKGNLNNIYSISKRTSSI